MKCPFVERDCIKRDCPGWSNGMCFVETLSCKLDVLCNLVSKICADVKSEKDFRRDLPGQPNAQPDPVEKISGDVDQASETVHVKYPAWEPISTPKGMKEATLAVDFGTALSKVAVRPRSQDIAIPIPLGEVASKILYDSGIESFREDSDNKYVEDSLVYIDNDGNVFCGTLARTSYLRALESETTRPPIQNLKQFLIAGGVDFSIGNSYFPSSETLNKQDVLATYLAYLFYLSRIYLGNLEKLDVDLASTQRNFSFPVWEDQDYKNAVNKMMKGAVAKAYCLEMWFKEKLVKGIPLSRLKEALKEASQYEERLEVVFGSEVTEPVAAGYSGVYDLRIEPGLPAQIFIVDVGAGSTDFALLTVAQPRNQKGLVINTHKQAGVDKGVLMWDNGLRALLRNRLIETAGVTPGQPAFKLFNAKLNLSLRALKERVIASEDGGYPIDVNPVFTRPIRVTREELESSKPVKDALSTIRAGFKKYINNVLKTLPKDKFDPALTKLLVTGGGSFIPSVVECIRECASILGPSYPRKVDNQNVPQAYAEIPGIADIYPLIAVSLGSTEKKYPKEQMIEPISPDPGPYQIGGYFTKGV